MSTSRRARTFGSRANEGPRLEDSAQGPERGEPWTSTRSSGATDGPRRRTSRRPRRARPPRATSRAPASAGSAATSSPRRAASSAPSASTRPRAPRRSAPTPSASGPAGRRDHPGRRHRHRAARPGAVDGLTPARRRSCGRRRDLDHPWPRERARRARGRARAARRGARRGRGSAAARSCSLAGEAGVGKTRLAEELAEAPAARPCWGRASQGAAAPYGPIVAVLRAYLRADPDGLADVRPPAGPPGADPARARASPRRPSDRADAVRGGALRVRAASRATGRARRPRRPPVVRRGDARAAARAGRAARASCRCSCVGAYRSDGLPRDHLLRRVRHELRRGGRLDELTLAPLEPDGDRRAAASRCSATARRPSLARRSTTARRACRSSSRSSRARCSLTSSLTPGRAGSSSARAARCRCPRRSATRC